MVCILITYWANLDVTYAAGAGGQGAGLQVVGRGGESFDRLRHWLQAPVRVEPKNLLVHGGRLRFTFFLKGMRGAFTGGRSTRPATRWRSASRWTTSGSPSW